MLYFVFKETGPVTTFLISMSLIFSELQNGINTNVLSSLDKIIKIIK